MNFLKHFLISGLVAVVVSVGVYGGYTIYAADERHDLYDPGLSYWEVFDTYHRDMNEFFNKRLGAMVDLFNEGDYFRDPEKQKQFVVPADIDRVNDSLATIVEKCNAGGEEALNVSSYCVSMEGLFYYRQYLERLAAMKSELEPEPDSNVDTLLLEAATKNEAAEKEVEDAKAILETTLSAYEEFANAYPMHFKYQEIITSLLKYKLALKDIRKEVQFFPRKFVNATSSYCK